MIMGFTGTRNGMHFIQRENFHSMVAWFKPTEFHHGACLGADEEAVDLIADLFPHISIHAHPGVSAKGGDNLDRSHRAMGRSHVIHPEETHFVRNRTIVRVASIMAAVPPCFPLPSKGGTVMTINETRKAAKPIAIFFPTGATAWENIRAPY